MAGLRNGDEPQDPTADGQAHRQAKLHRVICGRESIDVRVFVHARSCSLLEPRLSNPGSTLNKPTLPSPAIQLVALQLLFACSSPTTDASKRACPSPGNISLLPRLRLQNLPPPPALPSPIICPTCTPHPLTPSTATRTSPFAPLFLLPLPSYPRLSPRI